MGSNVITPPVTIGGGLLLRLENIKPSELDDSIRSILLGINLIPGSRAV